MLMTREGLSGVADRLEQGAQELGQVKDGLDVECEHSLEGRLVVLVHRGAPGGPGVVHEDVEVGFARRHLVRQAAALRFAREIRR